MSIKILSGIISPLRLTVHSLKISITGTPIQERYAKNQANVPKKKYPPWYLKQERTKYDENLTPQNREFIKEVVEHQFGPAMISAGVETYAHTPLKQEPFLRGVWTPDTRRSGLICKKLGFISQYTKDGTRIYTTMLQIIDNHVIKYIPPEEHNFPRRRARRFRYKGKMGCLIVGAVNCDPQNFTKEYCGLFSKAGVMPKKILTKFPITPDAAIQPGTPLLAAHFKVGDIVDVTGFTIDRGFQGVMKRWGFKGMPASHGVTKTHRRPGNIGSGGEKARVWPGQKLPGHMGNLRRTIRGYEIVRINHEYNVLYLKGTGVPGRINTYCQVFDTLLRKRKRQECPNFPTYYPEDHEEPLPEEEFHPSLFNLKDPTIIFEEEKKGKK